ncbi:MAG: hypothetical protein JO142_05875 [Burkholderiales bacterium]|nr:hypothetical protein [Burkholderiales bacterium]
MLVWRGYGILVFVFIVLSYGAARIGAEMMWGVPLPVQYRPLTELVGMLLATVLIYCFHKAIDQYTHAQDPARRSSPEMTRRAVHELLFIPVKFWPFVTLMLGIVLYFFH